MPTNMIDYLRIALYATLILILVLLFQAWDKEHPKTMVTPSSLEATETNNYVPQVTDTAQPAATTTTTPTVVNNTQLIHVKTDVAEVDINPVGGNIVQV